MPFGNAPLFKGVFFYAEKLWKGIVLFLKKTNGR